MRVISGGVEIMEHIWPLWEELNRVHLEKSVYYKERYEHYTVQMRKDGILERYKAENIRCFLLQDDQEVVQGYCLAVTEEGNRGKIESIYVKKELRGNGHGEELMEAGLKWLREQGIENISLEVVYGNDDVLDFYKKFGFYPKLYEVELKVI